MKVERVAVALGVVAALLAGCMPPGTGKLGNDQGFGTSNTMIPQRVGSAASRMTGPYGETNSFRHPH